MPNDSRVLWFALVGLCAVASPLGAAADTGGPDNFGTMYIDSDEPWGPVFHWSDLQGVGTSLALGDDDWGVAPIGFPFEFYGHLYDEVAIQSNGALTFDLLDLSFNNQCLPHNQPPHAVVAVFWDDLYPPGGEVLYLTRGQAPNREFVVQWRDVPFCCPQGSNDFQAILREGSGDVVLQYNDVVSNQPGDQGRRATVGVQGTPGRFLEYSCNSPAIDDGLAIRFYTCAGQDLDGDGWDDCDDCDDTDPTVHPGAADDPCDLIDNDCDGAPEPLDADGDGTSGCTGDCDDADPDVHPGAPERCDGIDNDCDGLAEPHGHAWAVDFDDPAAPIPLVFNGTAVHDLGFGILQLTEPSPHQIASAWFDTPVWTDHFLASFDMYMGGGSGGDGLTLSIQDFGPGHTGGGGHELGMYGQPSGRANSVEFDTQLNNPDPSDNHVATMAGNTAGGHVAVYDPPFDLDNGTWRRVTVLLMESHEIRIWIDGALVLQAANPTYQPFEGFIGFTAATGPATNYHAIDNVEMCGLELAGGLVEICDNGLDDDGDGLVDCDDPDCPSCGDADMDGWTVASGDCDDLDPLVYPGAAEICGDGVDQDCDLVIDEGCGGDHEICANGLDDDGDGRTDCDDPDCAAVPTCEDLDGDGWTFPEGDCDDLDPATHPGAGEVCDGADNDCDASIPSGEIDIDGDGHTECGGDCAPYDGTVHPGAAEICDGIDGDCNGILPDEEIDDVDGDGTLACLDCDDLDPSRHPGAQEITCDGVDQDCDGVDPGAGVDLDGDGAHACDDCNDIDPAILPGAEELCNDVDDNCDGLVDEGHDADGDGWTLCRGDCDDLAAGVHPGAREIRCNGVDEDCNGHDLLADEDGDSYFGCDVGGEGLFDCNDSDAGVHPNATESCNGRDDDCDGFVDEELMDCPEGIDDVEEGPLDFSELVVGGCGTCTTAGDPGPAWLPLALAALSGALAVSRRRH